MKMFIVEALNLPRGWVEFELSPDCVHHYKMTEEEKYKASRRIVC